MPRAGDDPGRRHLVRRAGPRARGRGRAARRGARGAGRGRRGLRRRGRTTTSPSRPTCGSPAGLDYYTGTVLEIFMAGYERLEVRRRRRPVRRAGERRPDDVPRRRHQLRRLAHADPAVRRRRPGAGSRAVPSTVLVALVDEESRGPARSVATALRRRGIATEVAASAQKFGKQIRYAERRGIPYVWFPDDATRSRTSGAASSSTPTPTLEPPADDHDPDRRAHRARRPT